MSKLKAIAAVLALAAVIPVCAMAAPVAAPTGANATANATTHHPIVLAPNLSKDDCTQLGADVVQASRQCKSGYACSAVDESGVTHAVCISVPKATKQ
jgi:hypothetical protein